MSSVLVVEDNPPLRRMVAITLRTAGYDVIEAADGREAIALARAERPRLVLQDLMLPDMDGTDLAAALRALPHGDEITLIAVSGSPEKLEGLREPGGLFTELLLKPVEPSTLLASVARHAAPWSSPRTLGAGRRVVLADDDPTQRKLTRLLLERSGFEVSDAADGRHALELVRADPPDVIVSDVLMPGVDGFELCRAVRSDSNLAGVPVVLVSSAYVDSEDRELALRAGASALVTREPDLAQLLATLGGFLDVAPPTGDATLDFTSEHARRVRAQLERQVCMAEDLRRRLSLQAVEVSVLAGISGALARSGSGGEIVGEALSRCLEVTDIAAGLVMLRGGRTGTLTEINRAGVESYADALAEQLVLLETTAKLLPASVTRLELGANRCAVAVPLQAHPSVVPLGWLAIGWGDGELVEPRIAFARTIGAQLSEAISLARAFDELDLSREETISRLALAAESRDRETARHTERVSRYSGMLAERLGMPAERVKLIRLASVMHDVGKIGVSDAILMKRGRLTVAEFEVMKRHTTIGHRILDGSDVELLKVAANIALTHHERYDGGGYPLGLAGEAIPTEGRIVAVADVFDALTSDRVYRSAFSVPHALGIMVQERGTHFDPRLLDILLESTAELAGSEHR